MECRGGWRGRKEKSKEKETEELGKQGRDRQGDGAVLYKV